MKLTKAELKEFLDEKVELYNRPAFIELDPLFKKSAKIFVL
jgi:hypothetical protein